MSEDEKNFFNSLACEWDAKETVSPEKYRRVIKEAGIEGRQDILDVGTGTGVLIPYILEKASPGSVIFAIDYAEKMLAQFQNKNFPCNVNPLLMDIHETAFEDNFFSRIIVNACYPHLKNKIQALGEIYRILKPGGIAVISHPTGLSHVNSLHKSSHKTINRHILDGMPQMKKDIQSAGFSFIKEIDEENFFMAVFHKKGGLI